MKASWLHDKSKWAILPAITAMFLSISCTLFSPPPPPPPPPPPNQSPIIQNLASENEILNSSESQITCRAIDADGDVLSYRWSANGGTIKGEGNSITWIAPDTGGDYTVKVWVTDGKGDEATASTTITVVAKPNNTPVIVSLTRDGSPPDDENRIREWNTVTIQCIAEDTDGDKLNYLWRATGGKITGEGNAVGWTSPGVAGEYTITVIVNDGRGGQAEKSMKFKVVCCGG